MADALLDALQAKGNAFSPLNSNDVSVQELLRSKSLPCAIVSNILHNQQSLLKLSNLQATASLVLTRHLLASTLRIHNIGVVVRFLSLCLESAKTPTVQQQQQQQQNDDENEDKRTADPLLKQILESTANGLVGRLCRLSNNNSNNDSQHGQDNDIDDASSTTTSTLDPNAIYTSPIVLDDNNDNHPTTTTAAQQQQYTLQLQQYGYGSLLQLLPYVHDVPIWLVILYKALVVLHTQLFDAPHGSLPLSLQHTTERHFYTLLDTGYQMYGTHPKATIPIVYFVLSKLNVFWTTTTNNNKLYAVLVQFLGIAHVAKLTRRLEGTILRYLTDRCSDKQRRHLLTTQPPSATGQARVLLQWLLLRHTKHNNTDQEWYWEELLLRTLPAAVCVWEEDMQPQQQQVLETVLQRSTIQKLPLCLHFKLLAIATHPLSIQVLLHSLRDCHQSSVQALSVDARTPFLLKARLAEWLRRRRQFVGTERPSVQRAWSSPKQQAGQAVWHRLEQTKNGVPWKQEELQLALDVLEKGVPDCYAILSRLGTVFGASTPEQQGQLTRLFYRLLSDSSSWEVRSLTLSSLVDFAHDIKQTNNKRLLPMIPKCLPVPMQGLLQARMGKVPMAPSAVPPSYKRALHRRWLSRVPPASTNVRRTVRTLPQHTIVLDMPTRDGRTATVLFPPGPESVGDIRYMLGEDEYQARTLRTVHHSSCTANHTTQLWLEEVSE